VQRRSRFLSPVLTILVVGSVGVAGPAIAAGNHRTPPLGRPSMTATAGTPELATTSKVEQVRQLVHCGNLMYAVGTFTRISQAGSTYSRENVFSFMDKAPYRVTAWHPKVNGIVNSIAVTKHCTRAYLGGEFTRVNERHVSNIAEVTTRRGIVVRRFHARANLPVETVLARRQHLLTGGHFTEIDGRTTHKYFASLSLATGKDDGYLSLRISGHYSFKNNAGQSAEPNPTKVYNQQLSPDGKRLLVEGDFTSFGGEPRQQIAMLRLGKKGATTTRWHAIQFNGHCQPDKPFYATTAAWSPSGNRVYVATAGGRPAGTPGGRSPVPDDGLCDAASAYSSQNRVVHHIWVNFDGCDSLFSVAADSKLVFVGGHNRWFDNPHQCNNNNNGKAVTAEGMAGLTIAHGAVSYNPGRSRGYGADDMLVTKQGLWIASDNFNGADMCGGATGHAGICLLSRVS
jgi:hypothetical protein